MFNSRGTTCYQAWYSKVYWLSQFTNILNEPWLNDDQHPFIISSHPALVNQKVSALVKTTINEWDEEVLRDVLTERDYKLVIAIPLSQTSMEDKWHWYKEYTGLFSVRSACQLIQDSKPVNGQPDNSGFWRCLWQLKVPPKVKNFLWRACTNCLPTCFQLSLGKVPIEVKCPICHGETETILHILVECPFSYNCWRTAAISQIASAATSFAGWFDDGLKLWKKEEQIGATMLCWSIWNNRNNSVWNSKQSSSFISPSGHGQQGRFIEHWTKPNDPYINVNVDGAIFSNEECFGYGLVARNSSGYVIEAVQIRKIGTWSPLLVEAMGLKEALSWIKRKDWHHAIIESDCLTLINDIKNAKTLDSPYGFVLQDCRGLLTSLFDVDCKFVKRSANGLAHALARASLFEADRILSGDSLPTCYASIILGDLI
uniref:RNase H type-1 domain-containing protein n=1 Tax=Cannabis sativa TaxID=3483 RepID=A0A803PQX4_CANSA